VQKSTCNLYKCGCTCDVKAGFCDYNCCCDPDCSTDQVSRMQSLGACSSEGASPDTTQYCYSSKELYAVNPRSPMGGENVIRAAVGDALCVVKVICGLLRCDFSLMWSGICA
jgi:hypothetical protein